MPPGRLHLVPSLLGVTAPTDVLPQRTIEHARGLAFYVVENAKPARQFLKALAPALPLQSIRVVEIGTAPDPARCAELLAPALAGHDLGLLSDAGCPGVADPGALLVAAAHRHGIAVVPLVGPSSLLLALMASGMNGQGFAFHGYLPVKAQARGDALRRLESASARDGQAQLFIETPYRNEAMLRALVAHCRPPTRLCVAADLTTASESIETRTLRDWQGRDFARYDKRPAIFILQAG
ncbi:MAG: SAM-dependent methyltransferase [Betaproteobacteria bacterium]|nr:SAM-dependent methyltransferase [Betaproteobacteria bacterium]